MPLSARFLTVPQLRELYLVPVRLLLDTQFVLTHDFRLQDAEHGDESVHRHVRPLGKIKHIGVSNHNMEQIALADRILGEAGYRVEAVQNHHSLLYRESERAGILKYCREHDVRFFSYMILEQGALTGRYSPANPMPEGSSRAAVYNGILPQLRALTDRMGTIGNDRGASAADVATAWAIAKGTTPIIGITKAGYIDGLIRARGIELSGKEIAELETLADAADVNTRGWWEQEM
ncbi:MAG TPA: aldo/keto reductase [Actinocrinis sp.]|nr:aldo/keto reductase [Actinocrinis sp.]HZP54119.1 aldo/keto reductase [Actinocrinis sp.]